MCTHCRCVLMSVSVSCDAIPQGNTIYVLAVEMFKAPRCGGYKWCHQAVTVDASAYPSVVVKYYLDGELHTEVTKELTVGSPASRLEDEVSIPICISFARASPRTAWTLATFGDLWGPMGTFGDLWGQFGTFGDLWAPLGTYGGLWGPMGTYSHTL